jgi:hypothetical protein
MGCLAVWCGNASKERCSPFLANTSAEARVLCGNISSCRVRPVEGRPGYLERNNEAHPGIVLGCAPLTSRGAPLFLSSHLVGRTVLEKNPLLVLAQLHPVAPVLLNALAIRFWEAVISIAPRVLRIRAKTVQRGPSRQIVGKRKSLFSSYFHLSPGYPYYFESSASADSATSASLKSATYSARIKANGKINRESPMAPISCPSGAS